MKTLLCGKTFGAADARLRESYQRARRLLSIRSAIAAAAKECGKSWSATATALGFEPGWVAENDPFPSNIADRRQ